MRLADAELLPLDFQDFTETIGRYVQEVEKLARDKRDQTIERNRQIDDGVFAAIDDPRNPKQPLKKEPVPPILNFAPLENGLAALQHVTELYDRALAHAAENGAAALARGSLRDVNQRLILVERALTLQDRSEERRVGKERRYR